VAAVAASALLLGGCSGSGNDNAGGGHGEQSSVGAPAASGRTTLAGVWDTKAVSQHFVLTVAGKAVSLLRDQKSCMGQVGSSAKRKLALKCPGGMGDERTRGTVVSLDAKTLRVKWNGGETDRFFKVADAPKTLPRDPEKLQELIPGG
jgi:hypothetical protein